MARKQEKFHLQEGERRFTYYAFISYKHKDKRWAKWLQQSLEAYRLPNRLCRESDIPHRLTPIFRDETDLAGGKTVYEHINEKLTRCKYLIVVCTRNMKYNPEYINFEIEQFLAAGNPPGRIIPFIIDDPGESPETRLECFPPALIALGEQRPLGITLDVKKKRDAVLKLVATMLELEINSLRSHDQSRRFRQTVGALSAGLVLALLFGATVAWEMLSVKQAKLREQLVYAEETYSGGDRYSASAMADDVMRETGVLMDQSIADDAKSIRDAASICPKFSSLTHLERTSADSVSMFDRSGEHVMIITGNTVKKYDLNGTPVLRFDVSGLGQKIVAVSSDGVHAVVMKVNDVEWGSSLWLYDMNTRTSLAKLASSSAYDVSDQKRGNLSEVLDAEFSPDGRLCAAFCTGGYFNENDTLPVYSSETGEKLFEVDGEMLGSRSDGGRGAVVNDFEFVSDTLLKWSNDHYNVYYSTITGEALRASRSEIAGFDDIGLSTIAGRYAVGTANGDETTFVVADAASQSIHTFAGGEPVFGDYVYGGKYALLAWGGDVCSRIDIIDLESMECVVSTADCEDFKGGYKNLSFFEAEGSARIYVAAEKTLANDMFRFDPSAGSCIEIRDTITQELNGEHRLISGPEGRDILLVRGQSGTRICEIQSSAVDYYSLDEAYESFARSAVLPPVNKGAMLAESGGMYSLYALENPGQNLTEGMPAFPTYAIHSVSDDGRLVLKAGGSRCCAWNDGEIVLDLAGDQKIVAASVSADGSRILVCREYVLELYSSDGSLLAETEADKNRIFVHAKMSGDASGVILLDALDSRFGDEWYGMKLLDGATLSPVSRVSGDVLRSSYTEPAEVCDISPCGNYAAAVERVYIGRQYERVITVWSAKTGEQLARTFNLADNSTKVLEFGADIGMADVFTYACFGENGRLLAGASTGVWVFDMEKMETVGYLADAEPLSGLPQTMGDDYLLYPCDDLHIWKISEKTLVASLAADFVGEGFIAGNVPNSGCVTLSADEKMLFVSDRVNARIFDTRSWEEIGRMSNCPAATLYMDENCLVYTDETGLYRHLMH